MTLSRRTIRFALIAWAMGVGLGAAMDIAVLSLGLDGPVRVIANLLDLLALPGWLTVFGLGFYGHRSSPVVIVGAHAIAWAVWIAVILVVLHVRGRVVRVSAGAVECGDQRGERTAAIPSRRAFICNAAVGTLGVGAVVSPAYATMVEPWELKVRRYRIPVLGLPEGLVGLTLAQFSDTHLGPRIPASFMRRAVELVVGLKPDIVLLNGDYVHSGTGEIDLAAEICGPLAEHAKIGAVGVLGNHDWWGDGARMSRELSGVGVRMIDNDRLWLDADTRTLSDRPVPGASLAIVGLGDLTEDVVDPARAFRDIEPQTPRLVLAHHPDTAELAMLTGDGAPRIDLMCSGHTHGGQVRLPLIGTPIVPSSYGSKYAGGLVQGPAFRVLVSRGVGMSMLPVRLGVPPEVSLITLSRA